MNTTKRTRRKFSDQDKQTIIDEAETAKAAGGEYKDVLAKHALTSSTLAKWRKELSTKPTSRLNGSRKASKASKRKIASKLTLNDIVKELANLDKELTALEERREKLLSTKVSDLLPA